MTSNCYLKHNAVQNMSSNYQEIILALMMDIMHKIIHVMSSNVLMGNLNHWVNG